MATPQHVGVSAACFCPGMRIDSELAADQAPDDAVSVCFDTDALELPLEILGRPAVEFAFSADRPVGQLCFRLIESGSHVVQRYSIHPDDPLSARHEARWRYEFGRGDWSVRINSESVMTSDAEAFHLAREVTAREGSAVVISRRWEEDIPRRLS